MNTPDMTNWTPEECRHWLDANGGEFEAADIVERHEREWRDAVRDQAEANAEPEPARWTIEQCQSWIDRNVPEPDTTHLRESPVEHWRDAVRAEAQAMRANR